MALWESCCAETTWRPPPFFSLYRAEWVPSAIRWGEETGLFERVESTESFPDNGIALEVSRFLALSLRSSKRRRASAAEAARPKSLPPFDSPALADAGPAPSTSSPNLSREQVADATPQRLAQLVERP